MKVLYFGTYERTSVRYRVVKKGLLENGVDVIECHVPFWEKSIDKTGGFFRNKSMLVQGMLKAQASLLFKSARAGSAYDAIMVSYIGQFDMFAAKLLALATGKPLVFDPLVSLSETLDERGLVGRRSLLYRMAGFVDKFSCRAADLIMLDTLQNVAYFSENFGAPKGKLCRIFVGADGGHFYPREKKSKKFIVCFCGKFSPNHGIEYILQAARMLEKEDVEFHLIGRGQIFDEVKAMCAVLRNVKLLGWIDYEHLPEYVKEADVCLGMFRGTEKIRRVAATKVFEALAMGKPLITGDCAAAREALTDGENALLCRFDDAGDLAEKILLLKNDRKLREKLSKNAYKLFREHYSEERIGASVIECFREKGYW